jgi:hypothetical protein
VLFDTDAADLADETGGTTPFGLVYDRSGTPPGPFVNLGVFNDLQDSGVMCSGFELQNLVAGSPYTLAVYGAFSVSLSIEHEGGFSGGPCTSFGQTYTLPGTEGGDYCLHTGLLPAELSPGVYGFRVTGVTGPILALQIQGEVGSAGPPPDESAPICWLSDSSDGPPKSIQISAQDEESGLAAVNVLASDNASVTVPAFDSGVNEVVVVAASQIDPHAASLIRLELLDEDGNTVSHDFEMSAAPEEPEEPENTDCDAVLSFFDEVVEAGTLLGNGPGNSANGRRAALRNMIEEACSFADEELYEEACGQLTAAFKKCDGDDKDFVTGDAVPELAERIGSLRTGLCGDGSDTGSESGTARGGAALSGSGQTVPLTWGLIKTIYAGQN